MDFPTFIVECQKMGIHLTPRQIEQFTLYVQELIAWNAHTNLTAIRTEQEILSKHFLDSLSVLSSLPPSTVTLADIGTGAGFPGIPLKIVRPELHLLLIDAAAKKIEFLHHIIKTLALDTTQAIHGRSEELAHDQKFREKFDVVVSRAVADLSILAEYCLPFVTINGLWIAQKNAESESVESASTAIKIVGGQFVSSKPLQLLDLSPRQLIIVKKITETPDLYPRRSGIPSKKPL